MEIHKELELEDCPYCGGAALLEEEGGFCWYVICTDCGSQTAEVRYDTPEARPESARKAANLWNMGKIMRACNGD